MRFETLLVFLITIIIKLSTSTSTSNNAPSNSPLKSNNITVSSNGSTSGTSSASSSSTSDSDTSSDKRNTDNSSVNSDATISRTTLNNIMISIVNSSSINGNISYTSSSPPKTLIQYPYQSADQYEIDKLAGNINPNTVLHAFPKNLTYSYLERPPPPPPPEYEMIAYSNQSVSLTNSKRHTTIRIPMVGMAFDSLTPQEQAQAKLAHLTNTELKCYVAPPTNMSFEDMMGFWYVVRKVNNSEGTDYRYICEEIVYSLTGPTTFNKVSDVHFQGKWMTIHGNGTFVPPGIVVIDWAVLDDPSKPDRLVFTILGGKYDQWLIGYDCLTGKMKPEVVLQTRHKRVRAKYLNEAYKLIRSKKLPLDDMVCETGFKSSVYSKSHSHTSHGSHSHSSHGKSDVSDASHKSDQTHSSEIKQI